jgi:hypothetical protein
MPFFCNCQCHVISVATTYEPLSPQTVSAWELGAGSWGIKFQQTDSNVAARIFRTCIPRMRPYNYNSVDAATIGLSECSNKGFFRSEAVRESWGDISGGYSKAAESDCERRFRLSSAETLETVLWAEPAAPPLEPLSLPSPPLEPLSLSSPLCRPNRPCSISVAHTLPSSA